MSSSPFFLLLLVLPLLSSASRARPVFGTERFARSAPSPVQQQQHLLLRPFIVAPSGSRLSPYPLAASGYPRRDDPYRAFIEQEEFPEGIEDEGEEDEEEMEMGPPEYRHVMRGPPYSMAAPAESPQYRFSSPYSAYYEGAAELPMAYGRPAAIPRRRPGFDPVEDLEEEMRQEEEEEEAERAAAAASAWAPAWWGEEEQAAEAAAAAERAATEGTFLRNLILAQRYRDDSLRPGDASKRRRPDNGDRAVRELESLAGKHPGFKRASSSSSISSSRPQEKQQQSQATASPASVPTPAPPTVPSRAEGQKEIAMPRPATPPRRQLDSSLLVGRRKEEDVFAALERLLEAKSPPSSGAQWHHPSNQRSLQKRYVSGEDVMMRQLNELKRAP